jgi:hypothetical protein
MATEPSRTAQIVAGLLAAAALIGVAGGPLLIGAAWSDGLLALDGMRAAAAVWLVGPLLLMLVSYLLVASYERRYEEIVSSWLTAAGGAAVLGLALLFPALIMGFFTALVFGFAAAVYAIGAVGSGGALVAAGLADDRRASAERWHPLGFFLVGFPLIFALMCVPDTGDSQELRDAVAANACAVPDAAPTVPARPAAIDEVTADVALFVPLGLAALAVLGLLAASRRAAAARRASLASGTCVLYGRLVAADDDARPVEVELVPQPGSKRPHYRFPAFTLLRPDGTRVRVEPGAHVDLSIYPSIVAPIAEERGQLEHRLEVHVEGTLAPPAGRAAPEWRLLPPNNGRISITRRPPASASIGAERHVIGLVASLAVAMIVNLGFVRRFHLLRVGPTDAIVGVVAGSVSRRTASSSPRRASATLTSTLVRYRDVGGEPREFIVREFLGEACSALPLVVSRRLPTVAEPGAAPSIAVVSNVLTWSFVLVALAAYGVAFFAGRRR